MSLNIQSLAKKLSILQHWANYESADVLCITEHWLREPQIQSIILEDFTIVDYFCREKFQHGGVLIAVNKKLKAVPLKELGNFCRELDVEVSGAYLPQKKVVVLSTYRSNKGCFESFTKTLENIFSFLSLKYRTQQVVLTGDFNVNFLKHSNELKILENLLSSFDMSSFFREPSRNESCLDNMFISKELSNFSTGATKELHISDHRAQLLEINVQSVMQAGRRQNVIEYRKITDETTYLIREELSKLDWNSILLHKSAQDAFTTFHKTWMLLLNKYFPEIRKKISDRRKKPTNDEEIRRLKTRLDILQTIKKSQRTKGADEAYNRIKAEYISKIDQKTKIDNENYIKNSINKPKAIWDIIRREVKPKSKNDLEQIPGPQEFNRFFGEVGTRVVSEIDTTECVLSAADLLHRNARRTTKSCYLFNCSVEEIRNLIASLKNKSSKDIYGLSNMSVKRLGQDIAVPMTILINKCFTEGVFPKEMKMAKIIPIHKQGDEGKCDNYRPIAILPIISKIIELAIKNRIVKFLEKMELFSAAQHGYRKTRNTITAIQSALNTIMKALNDNEKVSMSNFDLSKAFDSISHDILLEKLSYYGFRGNVLSLLGSYLGNRTQIVIINNQRSQETVLTHGVPQGSILGPLLFLVYMNDMRISASDNLCIYCDDTSAIVTGKNYEELQFNKEDGMQEIKQWFLSNKLKLNEEKTKELIFSMVDDFASVEFLGLTLDSRLNWSVHIDRTCKKLWRAIYSLRRIKQIITQEAAMVAYYTYFHGVMTYGILAWGLASDASKVFILQKRALRVIFNMRTVESCRPIFKRERILTFPSIYIYEVLKQVHASRSGHIRNGDKHSINTRNRMALEIPLCHKKVTQNSYHYWGVRMYNKLPYHLKDLGQRKFNREIKNILLNGTYYCIKEYMDSSFQLQ